MAHVLTAGELITQRKAGQWSRVLLAVPEYHTIYTARLNGVPSSNDMVAAITFDGGSGTLSNVLPDMTLYVGSSAGAYDLGMCRIRKAPISGTFYIGETSDIDWVDNSYLTVVDDYSLWQKSIRIVNEVPFMDYDVAYSNQHASFDPVPIMGSHRVAKLTGASVNVRLGKSADTSAFVYGSTIASVAWTVAGASLDNAASLNPIATFTAAGTYLAYCLFTAANGKTFTGVRYVIIYDDDNPLIEDFQLSGGRGSLESGGYSFDVTLLTGTGVTDLRERSLVILVTEDYGEKEAVTMPAPITGAENILCVGWIADIENTSTSQTQEISFRVEGAQYWLRQIRDYPSGLELVIGAAAAWTDMPSMTVDRALWHFLHWRSTATRVMDIQLTGDARLATRFVTARANLWERIIQVAQPTIFARPMVDNFCRLFVEIEPQMEEVGDRTYPVVFEIAKDDIADGLSWTRRDVTPLSMLFFSGISVNTTGAPSSFFSISPGRSYSHFGEEESQDNYLVEDQDNSNALCGLYFGWRNSDPFNLNIRFTNSPRMIGIAPRQFFSIDLDPTDDPRGIGYDGNLLAREVTFSVNPDTRFIEFGALFEPESFTGNAVDGDVPTMEDIDFSIPNIPSLSLPSLPALPIIGLPSDVNSDTQPKKVIIRSKDHGVFWTDKFNLSGSAVEWRAMNSGLTEYTELFDMVVTPSGVCYIVADYDAGLGGYNKVYRAATIGGVWVQVWDISQAHHASAQIVGLAVNPDVPDQIAFHVSRYPIGGINTNLGKLWVGSGSSFSESAGFTNHRTSDKAGGVTCIGGKWYVAGAKVVISSFSDIEIYRFSNSGALETMYVAGEVLVTNFWLKAAGTQLVFYRGATGQDDGYKLIPLALSSVSTVTGMTPEGDFNGNKPNPQGLAISPDGTNAMGATIGAKTPYKSTDNLASMQSVGGVIPIGSDVWENCRDNFRWIFGGGLVLRLTMDQGATYTDKIGNLLTIAASIDVEGIRFIE